MTTVIALDLTEQQRELVRFIVVEGWPPEEAAKLAGYHPKSVYRTMRNPAVVAAIAETIHWTSPPSGHLWHIGLRRRCSRMKRSARACARICRLRSLIVLVTRRPPARMVTGKRR